MKSIDLSRIARRSFDALPSTDATAVLTAIERHAAEPHAHGFDLVRLTGEPDIARLRVGAWRVLFREDETRIEVIQLGRIGEIDLDPWRGWRPG